MHIHLALYKWKAGTAPSQIKEALREVEQLATKVPGILNITATENTSKYSEGYTHVIFVQGENQAAIDAYRAHPDHAKVAATIEAMEDHGIGVDFQSLSLGAS